MQFSHEAIACKQRYLDAILGRPELLSEVVARNIGPAFELIHIARIWEPGGGATLFRVARADGDLFLKVKHRRVCVESRLESERAFIQKPSLVNERDFLACVEPDIAPKLVFYDEQDGFCFLAVEWLDTFAVACERFSADEMLSAWNHLVSIVGKLFKQGIVHTDIHEGNICFRGNLPVLCDFEEARKLTQELPFEESLDYVGVNCYGNVGEFPANTSKGPTGLTCLARLRRVFQRLLLKKLPAYLESCNFDASCPFNMDELQDEDSRIYQSIKVGSLKIAGQRPASDLRHNIVIYLLHCLAVEGRGVNYLDIGSNMGSFCFLAAEQPLVVKAIGLEAFEKYVTAAELIGFARDCSNVSFHRFVCGEDRLDVVAEPIDFCTMLSVYHHIKDRDQFLDELRQKRPRMVLAEFATQERYYPQRERVEAEIDFIREKLSFRYVSIISHSKDYGRPLVLFSNNKLRNVDRFWFAMAQLPIIGTFFPGLVQLKRKGISDGNSSCRELYNA